MGHCKGGPHMSYSPNKMGHSPNEMSADLKYNPIDDIVKGKGEANYGGSWMSQHASKSRMGGPQMKYSNSMAMMKGDLDKDGKMSKYESKRQAAIEKNM